MEIAVVELPHPLNKAQMVSKVEDGCEDCEKLACGGDGSEHKGVETEECHKDEDLPSGWAET